MNNLEYKELHSDEYRLVRKKLLAKKGSGLQREFLVAAKCNETFLKWMKGQVEVVGETDLPLCPEKLTEDDFKAPAHDIESKLYETWELSPSVACRVPFWGAVTLNHIIADKIDSHYLAANGGNGLSGEARIDKVLKSKGDDSAKQVDYCVRTIVRRLSGLPEARGNRSVYVNCPFARAWWREKLVHEFEKEDRAGVREVLRTSQTYWEELVTLIVSKNSVFGSGLVRRALILYIATKLEKKSPELRPICKKLGAISASRELGVLDSDELTELMSSVILSLGKKP